MNERVVVEVGQGVNEVDYTRMGLFPKQGIERVVRAFLSAGVCYSGFLASDAGDAVNVTVAAGEIYTGGLQFVSASPQTRSAAAAGLPTLNSRSVIHLLVAEGQPEKPDNLEDRYYERVIDPENPISAVRRSVEDGYRTRVQTAAVTLIPGVEAAVPVAPAVPSNCVALAEVLVTNSGVQKVTQRLEGRVKSLAEMGALVADLVAALGLVRQDIAGIRTDLAALWAAMNASASTAALEALQTDVALLKDALDLPDDGSPYWADRFLDYGETDWNPATETGHVDFDARIEEGIRFAYDAKADFPLSLLNPNDPSLKHATAGLICPAYEAVPGITLDAATGSMPLGGVSLQTITVEHLVESRERIRYGSDRIICNNAKTWDSGKYDPIAGIFTSATGETYLAAPTLESPSGSVNHQRVRLRQFWKDEIEVPYDKYTVVQSTLSGVVKAETFLQHQERWVVGTDLAIKRWGAGASIKAVLCECTAQGDPDLTRVLGTSELGASGFKAWPLWTAFDLPKPAFTAPLANASGRARPYALVWFTQGDVDVMTAEGGAFLGGDLLTTTNGNKWEADLSKDICFRVRYANFPVTNIAVRLGGPGGASWNLSGGVENIDVLAPMIVPGTASATFQILVGSDWRSLDRSEAGASFLNGSQASYDARVLLVGNEWAMPILETVNSRVRLTRQKASGRWLGPKDGWTIGSNATQIKLKAVVAGYDPARHTLIGRARYGTGLSQVKAATGSPVVRVVPGREVARPDQEVASFIEWTFDFSPAVGVVEFDIAMTTNNYKVPCLVEWAVARKTA